MKHVQWHETVLDTNIKRPCECQYCLGCNIYNKYECGIFGELFCKKCKEWRCNNCFYLEKRMQLLFAKIE